MKRHRIITGLVAGVVSCSYVMTAGAFNAKDAGKLKGGLLLAEKNSGQHDINNYNTNKDDVVNVLDLCRIKKDVIDSNKPKSQHVSLEVQKPWITDDKSSLTVPVKIKGNVIGVSEVGFYAEYDSDYFKLSDAYASGTGQVSFSKRTDFVQYTVTDGANNSNEGYLLYLVFDVAENVPSAEYTVELTEIEYAVNEDGYERELTYLECTEYAVNSFEFSRGVQVQNPVTEVPNTTTAVTETEVTTLATTTVTTAKEPAAEEMLYFSLENGELSSDSRSLRMPVYINSNTGKIGAFEATVKYDKNVFRLAGVEQGNFDGYCYVGGNGDTAVFNMNNGKNIKDSSGVIAYLKFEVNSVNEWKKYNFELTDIKVSYYENWELVKSDKFKNKTDVYKYLLGPDDVKVTEPSAETTAVSETTTTTVEPALTEPPVTSVTDAPVTTTQQNTGDYALSEEQLWFIDKVNEFRVSNGKPKVTIKYKAFKAADERAVMLSKSFTEDLPDGRNYKWALYDNDIMPYCISQYINNTASTKEQAFSEYLAASSEFLLNDSMFDRFAVGHYTDSGGKNYWVMYTFG